MWLRKNHTRVNFSTQAAGEKRGFCATKYGSTPPPPPPPPAPTTTAAAATATAAAAAEVKVQSLIAHYVRISYVFYTSIYVRATHGQPSLPQCQCYYRACAATVAGMV